MVTTELVEHRFHNIVIVEKSDNFSILLLRPDRNFTITTKALEDMTGKQLLKFILEDSKPFYKYERPLTVIK